MIIWPPGQTECKPVSDVIALPCSDVEVISAFSVELGKLHDDVKLEES